MIHVFISATLYLLRVHTEISWSHGTIRGNVRDGTSQQGDGAIISSTQLPTSPFFCALFSLSTIRTAGNELRLLLRFYPTMLPEFARVRLRACLAGEVLSIALSQEGSIFHTKALRHGPAKTAFHSVASLALLIRLSLSALAALRAVGMP